MKELYNKPMLTVDEFKTVDVMTDSGDTEGIQDGDGGDF